MPGFSITMLLLPAANDTGAPSVDLILSLLDDSTGWKWSSRSVPKPLSALSSLLTVSHEKAWSASLKANDFNQFDSAVELACRVLIVAKLAWTTFPLMETAVLRSKVALPVGDCIVIT
jgi:dihydroxyacetone kinase